MATGVAIISLTRTRCRLKVSNVINITDVIDHDIPVMDVLNKLVATPPKELLVVYIDDSGVLRICGSSSSVPQIVMHLEIAKARFIEFADGRLI